MKITNIFLLILLSLPALSQKEITIKNIVDGTFYQRSVRSVNWMKDGRYYSALDENKVIKYDITNGSPIDTLVDGERLNLSIDDYKFSDDESQILLLTDRQSIYRRSFTAVYHLYTIGESTSRPLSNGRQSYATFSPDGEKVAFTRDNNLFYVDIPSNDEVTVTTDGEFNSIINGSSDWVYEEELYMTKAFEWSPDSRKIAFYKFDESHVREYNMQVWNDGSLYPEDYRYKYPKAGERNSIIEILIYDLEKQKKINADIGEEQDIYIPRIYWTRDEDLLSIQRLNRLQNTLDILHVNSSTGESSLILQDKSDTYIDFTFCDDLTYLEDGKQFLFSSERSGFKHFYLYDMDGKLLNQVTQGPFEAISMVGLDQTQRTPVLYYISTESSPREKLLYRISLNGKNKQKLSAKEGTVRVNMSGDCKYYINYFSDSSQPLQVSLFETSKNEKVSLLQENKNLSETAEEYGLVQKEYFTYKGDDGTDLPGFFLKPADFDDNRIYPVLVYQYSGPGSQNVSNSWGGSHYIFHQMMTQKGYIIAVVDTRGTGYRGADFKKQTYRQLGKLEVLDLIAAARHLGSLDYVAGDRIGIWGWSYGGYMSSLAILKGADVFKTAAAVAPVTTWRFYDTIYTERYLQRPQDNPSGYDDNSPIQYTDMLKGNYLLLHGTGDDNVHFQNAVALHEQLIKSGKQFDSFYYPDQAHGIGAMRDHVYQMLLNFFLEKL